jgi:hypothetical protein
MPWTFCLCYDIVHQPTWKILENAEQGTDMMKDSFALAYTFTGGTKVEGCPRRGLDMVEEGLRCYVPVGTRTGRVGTGGHSTWSWCLASTDQEVYLYTSTTPPQGNLAPKGTEPTFRTCRSWMVRSNSFLPSPMPSDFLALPTLPLKSASRMLRAWHAPDNPLTANRRGYCYVDEDTTPRERSRRSDVHHQ